MKKLIALTLALVMSLGLTACGSSASSAAASDATAPGSTAASSSESTAAPSSEGESTWPTDVVSLIVPATAGGGTDILTRLFADALADVTGGKFIVVNDTTGAGTVAAETVRNAEPDGLTLLAYHTGLCTSIASGQYDHSLDEFEIIGFYSTPPEESASAIFVPGNSPFNTMAELAEYAKAHPGELMSGIQQGSASQMITVMVEKAYGFESTHVDVGSNADKVTALMGNQLDYVMMSTTGNQQYVESGDLKCLMQFGVVNSTRSSLFPDVPTIEEDNPEAAKALPRLDSICYFAGPKGMSKADIEKISQAMKQALESEEVQAGYKKLACAGVWYSPEEATEIISKMQEDYTAAYNAVNG